MCRRNLKIVFFAYCTSAFALRNELTSKRFYAILKAEKAICSITCGLHDMAEIYAGFVADHTFDHLRLRTTRILCREEHTKAVNPDAKAPKSL